MYFEHSFSLVQILVLHITVHIGLLTAVFLLKYRRVLQCLCMLQFTLAAMLYTCEFIPRHSNISRFLKAGVASDYRVLYTQMEKDG